MTLPVETRLHARALLAQGTPRAQVAERLKVSKATVARWDAMDEDEVGTSCAVCLSAHAAAGALGMCPRCAGTFSRLDDRSPPSIIAWAASRARAAERGRLNGTRKGGA